MLIASHQPEYLPRLSFFYKMVQADRFVIITNLQFKKSGWQQRAKIQTLHGDHWLTVPVKYFDKQKIKNVLIRDEHRWREKHARTLQTFYGRSREKKLIEDVINLYKKNWQRLADLDIALILLTKDALGIKTPLNIDEEVSGEKYDLHINICKKYGASSYLSGSGSKNYINADFIKKIEEANIKHRFVEKDLRLMYPYPALHYILKLGRHKAAQMLNDS